MISCKSASRAALFLLSLVSLATTSLHAAPWLPFGPDGGDARRFAQDPQDPNHIFLGTANGWLYETKNSGGSWERLSRPGKRDDLVIDGIFIDPTDVKHLVVGAWVLGGHDGGVYMTHDGGHTWTSQKEMQGQAIISLASAPSDSKMLVIGTLKGVYQSNDDGEHFKLISPPDSTEIHEVQSIAIDPKDPKIIYAGTWHLPWKTTDGGTTWSNMKQGIIEDSDVFSIIVDPQTPMTIYTSACSGIYKSDNAGEMYHKVQGIPATARRTRVLMQDPATLSTVFAGTTEGLWRTQDAGKLWTRTTDPSVIVNDVFVDKKNSKHVMLATDRGGILTSDDGGDTFHATNAGFSARQITALKRDSTHQETLYAGVVNDKELGGVFQSDNGGQSWMQKSGGLEGRDVFSLGQAGDGTMIAGTAHGVFRLGSGDGLWKRVEGIPVLAPAAAAPATAAPATRPAVTVARNQFTKKTGLKDSSVESPKNKLPAKVAGKAADATPSVAASTTAGTKHGKAGVAHKAAPQEFFDGSVFALANSNSLLLAATSNGLLSSSDNGVTWTPSGAEGSAEWKYLAAAKTHVVSGNLHSINSSSDSGATWTSVKVPEGLTHITSIAVEPSGEIWVGGREGVYVSSNDGAEWTTPTNLYVNQVTGLYWDEASNRVLVTARGASDIAFFVQLPAEDGDLCEYGMGPAVCAAGGGSSGGGNFL